MATVHLICGPVGAGKTTHARALAVERRAALFSIDEWMATLFHMDAPSPPSLDWGLERVARCERQIWNTAAPLLALGIDVVLDLGFLRREQRDRFRALTSSPVRLVLVDAPAGVRRERVRERNRGSETFSVEVSDAMFEWAERFYEPPEDDERAARVTTTR